MGVGYMGQVGEAMSTMVSLGGMVQLVQFMVVVMAINKRSFSTSTSMRCVALVESSLLMI